MREFWRWSEYESIEPFGANWQIQQQAVLMARVFNYSRGKGEGAYTMGDFIPGHHEPQRQQQTADDIHHIFKAFVAQHNSRLKGNPDG